MTCNTINQIWDLSGNTTEALKRHNVFIGTNWEATHGSTLIAKHKEHQGYNKN